MIPVIVVTGWELFHREWQRIFRAKNEHIIVILISIIGHRLMISKSLEEDCEPPTSVAKAESDEVVGITEQDRRRLETLRSTSGLHVGGSAFPTVVHVPAVLQTEVPAAPSRTAPSLPQSASHCDGQELLEGAGLEDSSAPSFFGVFFFFYRISQPCAPVCHTTDDKSCEKNCHFS